MPYQPDDEEGTRVASRRKGRISMDGMTYGQRSDQPLVLIIDDAKDFTELVAKILRTSGFRTISAETGKAGLSIAEKYNPDAILLDLDLGDDDGRDVCREFKGRLATADTPILFVTGSDLSDDLVQGCYDAGAHDVISKPVRKVLVTNRLRVALNEQRLREDYKRLATQDPETGLENRRQFFLHLSESVGNAQRLQRDSYLLLGDIDNLTGINVRHSFELGDEAILTMARLSKRLISVDCRVGRIAGDTIGILLKRGNEAQALATAERISKTFAAIAFDPVNDPKHFHMSFGISRVQGSQGIGATADQLMHEADVALYAQKLAGGRGISPFWTLDPNDLPDIAAEKRHSRVQRRKKSDRSFVTVEKKSSEGSDASEVSSPSI